MNLVISEGFFLSMFCVKCSVISLIEINSIIVNTKEAFGRITQLLIVYLFYRVLCRNILQKGKLNFIDFRKAFDMVDRNKLLYVLLQNSVDRICF